MISVLKHKNYNYRFLLFVMIFVIFCPIKSIAGKCNDYNLSINIVKLRNIEKISSKGRPQDILYNKSLAPVFMCIEQRWPDLVLLIIRAIGDEQRLCCPIGGWVDTKVGDVAWFILPYLFISADWRSTSLAESDIESISLGDNLLENQEKIFIMSHGINCGEPEDCELKIFIAKNGRNALIIKWLSIWNKVSDEMYWSEEQNALVKK